MNRPTVPLSWALGSVLLAFMMGTIATYREMRGAPLLEPSHPRRFAAGRYLIEPSIPADDEPGWILNYTSAWEVTQLPPRPEP